MKGASFMVDVFEEIVHLVMYYTYSIKTFLCGRRGEFIVFIEVHSM